MGQIAEWSHETVLAGESASASRARDFVCVHLAEQELLYLVDDVLRAVSKLATDALEHAQSSFLVRLEQTGQLVMLTVEDDSSAARYLTTTSLVGPPAAAELPRDPAPRARRTLAL